jgi:hypothetical protein
MATLTRIRRTQVDASPNQFHAVTDSKFPTGLDGYTITNSNTTDVYVKFYDASSGNVTVGTTTPVYGAVLVPAASSGNATQVVIRSLNQTEPLQNFSTAITVAATTTENGSTSPTSDITVELFYYV